MPTSAVHHNSSKVLNISEVEIDDIMLSIHQAVTIQRTKGEFTTAEYATKHGMSTHKAYNELAKAAELGVVTVRQPGGLKTVRFWRKV